MASRDRDRDDRNRDSKSRGRFKYEGRAADDVKKRAERTGARFDSIIKQGFDTFRAKVGDNLFRILPPTWDKHDHYGYTVWIHERIGADDSSYLCLSKMQDKRCPVCDATKVAKDAGEGDEAKAMAAREKFVYWILDRDADDPNAPLLYIVSWSMDRDFAALTYNKRSGKVLLIDHPDEGYDITLKRAGIGLKTKYFGQAIDRDPSPIVDDPKKQDQVLEYITENPIPSTLNYFDAKHLEKVLEGGIDTKDEDLDEDADKDDKRSGVGRRRSRDEDNRSSHRRTREDDDEKRDDDDRHSSSRSRSRTDDDEDEKKKKSDGEDEDRPSRSRRDSRSDDEDDRGSEDEDEDDKRRDADEPRSRTRTRVQK